MEFMQAEEFIKQPSTDNNCVRDNRKKGRSIYSCADAVSGNIIPQGCVFVLDVVAACSNDYEDGDVDFKRGSNGLSGRKRRVVFDDSDDECEDAVNLSSGDIVNGQTNKPVAGTGEKHDTVMQDERKSDVGVGSRSVNAASSAPSKCGETKTSRAETMGSCIVQNDVKDNASSNIVPSSSKRNKVMKTWIDERGREVTEVVYEQDETEKKSIEIKKAGNTYNDATTKPPNREVASKKSAPAPTHGGGKADFDSDPPCPEAST
ncbi:hypothetical protein LINPERPRIM_LOCUS36895 [Linum perenne]